VHEDYDEARTILRDEPLFECLSDAQIDDLVKRGTSQLLSGRGERVIEEGAEGEFYVCFAARRRAGFGLKERQLNSRGHFERGRLFSARCPF